MNSDSSVGVVNRLPSEQPGNCVSITVRDNRNFVIRSVQTESEVHPASFSVGTMDGSSFARLGGGRGPQHHVSYVLCRP